MKIINKKIAETISAFKIGILFSIIKIFRFCLLKELIPIALIVPKTVERIVDKAATDKVVIIALINFSFWNIWAYA